MAVTNCVLVYSKTAAGKTDLNIDSKYCLKKTSYTFISENREKSETQRSSPPVNDLTNIHTWDTMQIKL